ncbi:MarR family transcriptional regulator [Streptomyces sp. NPDC057555]|uniref:MarR family transcriptional regulator n=1 Tax=Streptomyces sp. NPDC057555 TaxID=3346166 RepID=UPI00368B479D
MPDPTRNTTPPQSDMPALEPLTDLTGAAATVYAELIGLTEPVTVAELAHAARIGHSTAGLAVTTLEKRGLAIRTPGGHDGPRRMPDLWHPTPHTPGPGPKTTDTAPHSTKHHSNESDGSSESDLNAKAGTNDPPPQLAPPQPPPGKNGRLAPGALRRMVTDHLHAHPDEAFTATRISRVIEKSSGAIANVLVKLVATGVAEQVTDQPRTFRLTRPNQTDTTP